MPFGPVSSDKAINLPWFKVIFFYTYYLVLVGAFGIRSTPLKSNMDIKDCHIFKSSYLFLGPRPFLGGIPALDLLGCTPKHKSLTMWWRLKSPFLFKPKFVREDEPILTHIFVQLGG